jgi:membrane protease YdiL (CAAX protease family)
MDNQQPFTTPDFATAEPLLHEPAAPAPSEPTQKRPNRFFFGRFGFRAGYGIAIYIVAWAILTAIGGIAGVAASGKLKQVIQIQMQATKEIQAWKDAHPGQQMPASARPHHKSPVEFVPALVIGSDGVQFFGMLALAWLLARAERRRLGWYGIGANRVRDFLPGALWGLAALSALVFVLHACHLLYFDARLLSGGPLVVYGLKWLIAFLFVGFAEEYFLRGYMQFTLTRGVFGLAEKISPRNAHAVAFWIAAFLLSVLFACMHLSNGGENAIGILQVFIVGMVFAYALFRTGSLWWAIGFHMAWDWAQSFLYGVPDSGNVSVGRLFQTHFAGKPLLSGGADGPEGSLLCVPVFLLMLLIIRFTTKPGTLPQLEQLPREAVFVNEANASQT